MKENITWLILWCKRLIKKPLLLFTVLMMPLTVLFLQNCHSGQDAVLRVALYAEDSSGAELMQQMLSLSDSSIGFYRCKNKKDLVSDVKAKKANCGYLIPAHLEKSILSYVRTRKPFLTVVCGKDDVTTRIVDEIVLSKNYRDIARFIMINFIESHTDDTPDEKYLTRTFDSYYSDELLFQFQYLNGEENTILQQKHISVLLLPLRGMIAVLLLMTCMAGELMCFQDKAEGRYKLMTQKQKILSTLYSLSIPGIAASIFALLCIKMAGISENIFREIPAIACYLFACLGLVILLGSILRRQSIYLASLPVMLLLSLLLPPIFIDLANLYPPAGKLSKLLPTTYYLSGTQNPGSLLSLLLYGAACLLGAALIHLICCKRHQV